MIQCSNHFRHTVCLIEFHTTLEIFLGKLPKGNMPSKIFLQSFYVQNKPRKRKMLKKLIFENFLLMAEKRRSFWPFCLPYMIPLALCKNEMKVQPTFKVFLGMLQVTALGSKTFFMLFWARKLSQRGEGMENSKFKKKIY